MNSKEVHLEDQLDVDCPPSDDLVLLAAAAPEDLLLLAAATPAAEDHFFQRSHSLHPLPKMTSQDHPSAEIPADQQAACQEDPPAARPADPSAAKTLLKTVRAKIVS